MEINQQMLDALLSLSDKDLQEKIRMIAVSLGLNSAIANIQTRDAAKLRTALSGAGVDELNRMLSGLDGKEAIDILKSMENSGDGKR